MKKSLLIIFLVLFCDQAIKFYIKTNMRLGEQIDVISNFFYVHFTENYGMAFGLELEGDYGKLLLSLFRIFAVGGIGWYLYYLIKSKAHNGMIICISLIMSGAIGNILDSAFYGLLFNESTVIEPSVFLPEDGGYAGFLHGAVVDMFYFYSRGGHYPDWFPFWGGQEFVFSFPIFNLSDASISVGVCIILIFQKTFFRHEMKESVAHCSFKF
ncbi:MAG: lipoprotein signal peptidase [Bacteroidota bacterium]